MARAKATAVITRTLEKLSIPHLEVLNNLASGKSYAGLVDIDRVLVALIHADMINLSETDPHLAVKKARLSGSVDGIILLKQLMEHAAAELNRRMGEEKK